MNTKRYADISVLFFLNFGFVFAGQWEQTALIEGAAATAIAVKGDDVFVSLWNGSLMKSTDNGMSWTSCGGDTFYVTVLAAMGGVLFAGTQSQGVLLSTDDGYTWQTANNGLSRISIYSLQVIDTVLIASGGDYQTFASRDGGASWTAVGNESFRWPIGNTARRGSTIFIATGAGVFRSTDNGFSWATVNEGLSKAYVQAVAVSGSSLLAGTARHGLLRSVDDGASWTEADSGLTDTGIRFLMANGRTVFAVTEHSGIFRSIDDGLSWTAANDGLTEFTVRMIAQKDSVLFVGTVDSYYQNGSIFRSTNNGASWDAVNRGIGIVWVSDLLAKEDTVFAQAGRYGFFSTDNGDSWRRSPHDDYLAVNGRAILDSVGNSFFVSTDNGAAWKACTSWSWLPSSVYKYAISGTAIAAVSQAVLYISKDYGESWTRVGSDSANRGIQAIAASGSAFIAAFQDSNGLIYSTDNGTTWTESRTGLADLYIRTLSLWGNTVAVCMHTGELFLSNDWGASWTSVHDGLPRGGIVGIALHGDTLVAALSGIGIFRRDVSDIVNIAAPRPAGRKQTRRATVGLNAVHRNGALSVTYVTPSGGIARLALYSLSGKLIAPVVDGPVDAGAQRAHSVALNVETLPAGLYLLRLATGCRRENRRVAIIK